MRSVVVVLPASMWAMMPMLRTFSRGYSRAVMSGGAFSLPAVVRERLVGLGHLGHVLAPLDRRAHAVGGVDDLVGEALGHRLLAALGREVGQPADGQRRGATGPHLDRDLVGGAADASRAHLELGAHVLQGALERGHR